MRWRIVGVLEDHFRPGSERVGLEDGTCELRLRLGQCHHTLFFVGHRDLQSKGLYLVGSV